MKNKCKGLIGILLILYTLSTGSYITVNAQENSTKSPAVQAREKNKDELLREERRKKRLQPKPKSQSAEYLFKLVNDYRKSIGLDVLQKDDRLCTIAKTRGPELYDEIFVNHNMHAGFYAWTLPYYATENIVHTRSEDESFNWWLNSPIHRKAIQGGYTHSCVECWGDSCTQIFSSFVAK
jgi:uncharacterized protein YkwD